MVDANELKVIEEIARRRDLTQRELSAKTKLSLGAVNIIIKRLVKRGFVKTKSLNPKKVEYIITPKGFTEKTKKSYNYIQKTIDLVKLVREEIAGIVLDEYNRGQKKFVVLGNDDLADIIELALKGFNYQRVSVVSEIIDKDSLVLISGRAASAGVFRSINIADRLGETYWGVEKVNER
jgi:DNA-binding MarR family transcriptional regulator